MNELNPSTSVTSVQVNSKQKLATNHKSTSPAIAITNNKIADPNLLLMNANTILAPSSDGSSSSVFTVGSYFLINPSIQAGNTGPTVNTSLTSCTSSSSASSSSSSGSSSNEDSVSSGDVLTRHSRGHHFEPSSLIENNLFQDENLMQ